MCQCKSVSLFLTICQWIAVIPCLFKDFLIILIYIHPHQFGFPSIIIIDVYLIPFISHRETGIIIKVILHTISVHFLFLVQRYNKKMKPPNFSSLFYKKIDHHCLTVNFVNRDRCKISFIPDSDHHIFSYILSTPSTIPPVVYVPVHILCLNRISPYSVLLLHLVSSSFQA